MTPPSRFSRFDLVAILAILLASFASYAQAADASPEPAPAKAAKAAESVLPKASAAADTLLATILEKAKTYGEKGEIALGKAVDTVSAEAPIVVKEFLVWRAWKAGLTAVGLLFPTLLGLWFAAFCKKRWSDDEGWEIGTIITYIVTGVYGLISFFVIGGHVMDIIQIAVAPRIYLIEAAMALVHK